MTIFAARGSLCSVRILFGIYHHLEFWSTNKNDFGYSIKITMDTLEILSYYCQVKIQSNIRLMFG